MSYIGVSGLYGGNTREEELVQKILEKTEQGKIKWQRSSSAYTASTANGMQFDFILAAPNVFPALSDLIGSRQWVTFKVRDQLTEILKVENISNVHPPLTVLPALVDSVQSVVNALFARVKGSAQDEIGRAMTKLDQI